MLMVVLLRLGLAFMVQYKTSLHKNIILHLRVTNGYKQRIANGIAKICLSVAPNKGLWLYFTATWTYLLELDLLKTLPRISPNQ